MENHKHTFAVDCSCDCGIVLSEYVKELRDALRLADRALEIYFSAIFKHNGFEGMEPFYYARDRALELLGDRSAL